MTASTPRFDLRVQLARLREEPVAFVPDALDEPFLRRLAEETATLQFSTSPDDPFATRSELAVLHGRPDEHPATAELYDQLVDRVLEDAGDLVGVGSWRPNEIFVRRYDNGSTGMSPHLDGKRFAFLVATFTVYGVATFVRYDGTGRVVDEWVTRPGSLILLRAPGFDGMDDGRPRHAVGGPASGTRCSIAFRMNTSSRGRVAL